MKLTEKVHSVLSQHLSLGDCAVDMTAGNGWDTLFLSKSVGESGHIFSFDIQKAAIAQTKKLMSGAEQTSNLTLFHSCHTKIEQKIPPSFYQKVKAITFNLGYLPTSNKTIITTPQSTLCALEKSYEWMAQDGVMTILAYRGHSGGLEETQTITEWTNRVPVHHEVIMGNESPESPVLYVIKKSERIF